MAVILKVCSQPVPHLQMCHCWNHCLGCGRCCFTTASQHTGVVDSHCWAFLVPTFELFVELLLLSPCDGAGIKCKTFEVHSVCLTLNPLGVLCAGRKSACLILLAGVCLQIEVLSARTFYCALYWHYHPVDDKLILLAAISCTLLGLAYAADW